MKLDTMLVAIEDSFTAGHTSAGRRLIAEARDLVVDLMGPGPRCSACDAADEDDNVADTAESLAGSDGFAMVETVESVDPPTVPEASDMPQPRLSDFQPGAEIPRVALLASLPTGAKVPSSHKRFFMNGDGIPVTLDKHGSWRDRQGRFRRAPQLAFEGRDLGSSLGTSALSGSVQSAPTPGVPGHPATFAISSSVSSELSFADVGAVQIHSFADVGAAQIGPELDDDDDASRPNSDPDGPEYHVLSGATQMEAMHALRALNTPSPDPRPKMPPNLAAAPKVKAFTAKASAPTRAARSPPTGPTASEAAASSKARPRPAPAPRR